MVEFIVNSAAGFYVKGVRLSAFMVLKRRMGCSERIVDCFDNVGFILSFVALGTALFLLVPTPLLVVAEALFTFFLCLLLTVVCTFDEDGCVEKFLTFTGID